MEMAVTVWIPAPFRALVRGAGSVEATGGTVGEVLKDLGSRYEGLLEKICAPDGGLRSHVNVYVNQKDIRRLQGLDTPVGDGDQVFLVPAIAGG
jgi:molybdopterin converting factor small subunit